VINCHGLTVFDELMRKAESCGCSAGSYPVRLQRTWFAHYFFNQHQLVAIDQALLF
jgi:hypothetical protein